MEIPNNANQWQGKIHVLNGLRSYPIQPTEPHEIVKEGRQGQTLYAIGFTEKATELAHMEDELKAMIGEVEDIFQTPTGLPPKRAIEHNITLKEGTDPINVRLYRYAHFQKDEIERQVAEML